MRRRVGGWSTMRLVVSLAALIALAAIPLACGSKPARAPLDDAPRDAGLKKAAISPLIGHLLASIGERTIGPFLARRPAAVDGKAAPASLVAWVGPAEGTARRVFVVPLAGDGEPRGAEKVVAMVPIDTTSLVVRTMRGTAPGFVLAWTSLTDRGEALYAVAVGDDGTPRAKPTELARTADDVVWVDIIPTDAGSVAVWAEETRGGEANIVAAALDMDGKVRGVPARVAHAVRGWHATDFAGGVGVSTVSAVAPKAALANSGPKTSGEARGGALSFVHLDAEGHAAEAPIVVSARPTVSGDVEVMRVGKRLIFAWTDRTADLPFVALAALDERGVVAPTRTITDARGGSTLLGIASGPAGAALMWESPARPSGDTRRIHVARLGDELTLEGRALSLDAFGRATPELAATATGFAILAPMRTCEPPATECANQAPIPTMVRTDAHLSAVQREPFAFGTDPASMAWGLTCEADRCLALAASGASPARVRAADISPHVNLKPVPEPAPPPKDAPRVADLKAVQSGESVVDLAAARMGDATLLALLSARPDAPAHPSHAADESPRLATYMLTTRVVDAAGASSTPVLITKRALAVGGVSIAAAEKAEDGGAVAWIARENGDPEVHVTRIDKKGKRTNDVQLTTTKGDASDVSITWAGGGWVVAWVDGRDGNGEVYATKVGLDLTRTAREERITTAPGDASDLVALARGDLVWLAWADPRDSQADGMADIFVTAIGARDAKRTTVEHRVLATAAHSRTPQLAPGPNGVHVAWIEESPMGSERPEASGYGALWGTLDRSGKLVTKPAKLPLAGEGAATSVVLDTGGGALHALVARSGRDAITIDAIDLGGRSRAAYPLLTLDGPPSLDVALVMEGGILYFNDDGPTPADKRARRARIAWSPPAP